MEYKQYTKCIEADDFSSRKRYITIASLLAGAPAALIAVAMGHPVCLFLALEITALAGLVAYYHNWLYHRLICLGGDRHCCGVVLTVEEPSLTIFPPWKMLDRDTDYSMNLLLRNFEEGGSNLDCSTLPNTDCAALHIAAEKTLPYGELIKPQESVIAIGLNPLGHFAKDPRTNLWAPVMHAEFEGDGNYKMLLASKVLLAFAIYALVACVFGGPAGWLLVLITSLIILIFGSLLGLGGGGSPSDLNAGPLTIGVDIVYVEGAWVTDTLHDRWNEIHPIKKCTVVSKWDGRTWPADDLCPRLQRGFQIAEDEGTKVNQSQPENQWVVHPDLDGCASDIIL